MTLRRLLATRDLAKADVARSGIDGAATRVHFVGIGGVGMSGIAEVLCTLGYQVSGSDSADNADDAPAGGAGRERASRPPRRRTSPAPTCVVVVERDQTPTTPS